MKETPMGTTTNQSRRELANRTSTGIDVTPLWDEQTGELSVTAFDSSTGELLEVPAERERALDVFYRVERPSFLESLPDHPGWTASRVMTVHPIHAEPARGQ